MQDCVANSGYFKLRDTWQLQNLTDDLLILRV